MNINILTDFNDYAIKYLSLQNSECAKLYESVNYSVNGSGKRFRPLLMFSSASSLGVDEKVMFDLALAIELVHTYTLIHDDMPCLDDDDLRRGKATNHKVYGEDVAILAGDVLQALAFDCVSRAIENGFDSKVLKFFSKACIEVVEGQSIDIDESYKTSVERLQTVHLLKTGSLIKFCVIAPLFYNKKYELLDDLSFIGDELGLVFQIMDDILDYTGTDEELGKTASDFKNNKNTYVTFLKIEGSRELVEDKKRKIEQALLRLNLFTDSLKEICEFSVNRSK